MRTDVKVGLFVGIVALVLAGWFFWPDTQAQKPTQAIAIGGRDTMTADRPVVRPPGSPALAPQAPVSPSSTVDIMAPNVPPTTGSAVPATSSPVAGADPVPTAPGATALSQPPVAVAPSAEPSIPAAGRTSSPSASPAGATIGREPLVHVVRAGDTLEKIAQTYYGNMTLAGALRQANPQLGAGKRLRAGSKIKVPAETDLPRLTPTPVAGSSDASLAVHVDTGIQALTAAPATQPAGTTAAGAQEYKVQKGDTLYSIAVKRLGSGKRWHELLALNADKLGGRAESLRPGQILRLAK